MWRGRQKHCNPKQGSLRHWRHPPPEWNDPFFWPPWWLSGSWLIKASHQNIRTKVLIPETVRFSEYQIQLVLDLIALMLIKFRHNWISHCRPHPTTKPSVLELFYTVSGLTHVTTQYRLEQVGGASRLLQPAASSTLLQSRPVPLLKCPPLLSPSDINAFKISVKRLLAIFLHSTLPDPHVQLHPDVHLTVLLPSSDARATLLTASLEADAASAPAEFWCQLRPADSRPVLRSCWRGFQNAPRRRPASPSWLVVPFFAAAGQDGRHPLVCLSLVTELVLLSPLNWTKTKYLSKVSKDLLEYLILIVYSYNNVIKCGSRNVKTIPGDVSDAKLVGAGLQVRELVRKQWWEKVRPKGKVQRKKGEKN